MSDAIYIVLIFCIFLLIAILCKSQITRFLGAGYNTHRFFGGDDVKIVEFDAAQHSKGVKDLQLATFDNREFANFSFDYSKYQGWVLIDQSDKICGLCLYDRNNPYDKKEFGENTWNFADFAVSKELSGRGYGSQLLQKLIDAADREGVLLTLRAYKGYSYLIKLYSRFGFSLVPNSENGMGSPRMIRPAQ